MEIFLNPFSIYIYVYELFYHVLYKLFTKKDYFMKK